VYFGGQERRLRGTSLGGLVEDEDGVVDVLSKLELELALILGLLCLS
jgi:hypothetical protein